MSSSPSRRPALLLLLLFLLPCATQAQSTEGRARFLKWAYQDAGHLAQQANRNTPLYMLGTSMVLLQLSQSDGGMNPRVRRLNHGAFSDFLDVANVFGGPRMNAPVAALFVFSLGTRSRRFQDAAFTSLQSLVYAGAIGYGLKYTFGRARPHARIGTHDFRPFSGRTSFPSGHTTTAFAVLTPWVLYYPHPVTYTLFGLATGTATARLVRDKHWFSDVVAGGALGFLTARWLTRQHQGRSRGLRITPVLHPDALALSFSLKF